MNRYLKLLPLIFLLVFSFGAFAQKTVKNYIHHYKQLATEKMEQHKIPASIILGVSIVESGAGRSPICKKLNNFFGIKGKNKASQKKMGYKSAYREYANDVESFEHFCQIIQKKKFYAKLKGTIDYKKWLKNMNDVSYATAKQKWIEKVSKTIVKYQLYKLDKESSSLIALLR